jgi:hypothetical protein
VLCSFVVLQYKFCISMLRCRNSNIYEQFKCLYDGLFWARLFFRIREDCDAC